MFRFDLLLSKASSCFGPIFLCPLPSSPPDHQGSWCPAHLMNILYPLISMVDIIQSNTINYSVFLLRISQRKTFRLTLKFETWFGISQTLRSRLHFKDNCEENLYQIDLSTNKTKNQSTHLGIYFKTGLIQVKEGEWTEFSKGWQRCSEGFSEGKAWGIFIGRSQREIPRSSPASPRKSPFISDLHSISNRVFQLSKIVTRCRAETIFARLIKASSDEKYKFVGLFFSSSQIYVRNLFAICCFVEGPR